MKAFSGMFAASMVVLSVWAAEGLRTENADNAATSLYSQSAGQIIRKTLAACVSSPKREALCSERENLSYLLLDTNTGAVLAADWANSESPIPLGSLVKPFTALAYGEKHEFRYPAHNCRGTSSGCWLPRGHGQIGLQTAIADSCNSYFRMLAVDMSASDVLSVTRSFRLQSPNPNAYETDLIGLGTRWLISPLAMAQAYAELTRRSDQPGVREILAGMALSGRQGTGAEVDRALKHASALVKTGTAVCTHAKRAPGDGFAVAVLPAENPEILLMVRVHGIPGSHAARIAGEMLGEVAE